MWIHGPLGFSLTETTNARDHMRAPAWVKLVQFLIFVAEARSGLWSFGVGIRVLALGFIVGWWIREFPCGQDEVRLECIGVRIGVLKLLRPLYLDFWGFGPSETEGFGLCAVGFRT